MQSPFPQPRSAAIFFTTPTPFLPLSGMLHGEYGFSDVCLSVPFVLNRDGLVNSVTPPLTDEEAKKFSASAEMLKETIAKLNI